MELFSVSINNSKVITRRKNKTQKVCLQDLFLCFYFFLSEKFSCKPVDPLGLVYLNGYFKVKFMKFYLSV